MVNLVRTAENVFKVRIDGQLSEACAVRLDELRFSLYDANDMCQGAVEGHTRSHALAVVGQELARLEGYEGPVPSLAELLG